MATLHKDGLTFRLCIYFALNPGSVLFTGEICERWKIQRRCLSDRLEAARRLNWLTINKVPGEIEQYYTAGPALEAVLREMT